MACASRTRHSSSLKAGSDLGTIEGIVRIRSVWVAGMESPPRNPASQNSGANESIWRLIGAVGRWPRPCDRRRGAEVIVPKHLVSPSITGFFQHRSGNIGSGEFVLAPRAGFEPATIRLTVS